MISQNEGPHKADVQDNSCYTGTKCKSRCECRRIRTEATYNLGPSCDCFKQIMYAVKPLCKHHLAVGSTSQKRGRSFIH